MLFSVFISCHDKEIPAFLYSTDKTYFDEYQGVLMTLKGYGKKEYVVNFRYKNSPQILVIYDKESKKVKLPFNTSKFDEYDLTEELLKKAILLFGENDLRYFEVDSCKNVLVSFEDYERGDFLKIGDRECKKSYNNYEKIHGIDWYFFK